MFRAFRAIRRFWHRITATVTVIAVTVVVLKLLPVPFFDRSGTTLMMPSEVSQVATATALAEAIGNPAATLDTPHVHRFLFKDGTSVDWLAKPPAFEPMYHVVALKSIVIGFWRSFFTSPYKNAERVRMRLERMGHKVQVAQQPDPAIPQGSVVLILSSAFMTQPLDGSRPYGIAILIRKHAFRIGGPTPQIGSPFRSQRGEMP